METTRHTYQVHAFDTDAFGQLAPSRLLGYLLDAAGHSANRMGFGIKKLQSGGLSWVLGRLHLVVPGLLLQDDLLEVRTWPSGIERGAAFRNFQVWREQELVGQAASAWFVIDLNTRLPVRPQGVLPPQASPAGPHEVPLSRDLEAPATPSGVERCFEVRRSDIDLNLHVTATTYLDWALEAISESTWKGERLASIDVHFMEECHIGSAVVASSGPIGPGCLWHQIRRHADGAEIARLRTAWTQR